MGELNEDPFAGDWPQGSCDLSCLDLGATNLTEAK
jgi:hypothetical protein